MTDFLALTDLLANGAGAYVTSDRGGITLLMISTDTPDQATIRRVRLESGVSLTQLIDAANQARRPPSEYATRECPACHRQISTKSIKKHIPACMARGGAPPLGRWGKRTPQAAPDAPQGTEGAQAPTDTGNPENGAREGAREGYQRVDNTGALSYGRLKMVRTTPHGTKTADVAERMRLEEPATGDEVIQCAFCSFIGTGHALHRHNRTEHRDRYEVAAYDLGAGVSV